MALGFLFFANLIRCHLPLATHYPYSSNKMNWPTKFTTSFIHWAGRTPVPLANKKSCSEAFLSFLLEGLQHLQSLD